MNDGTLQELETAAQISNIQSGKVSGWLKSGTFAKLTGFASFGAKKVVLSWDVPSKMVVLNEVDSAGNVTKAYFSIDARAIERSTFFHNNYFLRVGGVKYDISLRDIRANSGIKNDIAVLVDTEVGGILGAHADSQSEISQLQQLLQSVNPKTTYASKISSKTYAKNATIAIVVIIIIVAIILIGVYSAGRLHQ